MGLEAQYLIHDDDDYLNLGTAVYDFSVNSRIEEKAMEIVCVIINTR